MQEPMPGPIEFDSVAPTLIATRIGTPAFVMSRNVLQRRLIGFASAMNQSWAGTRCFYSAKANPNPWVLREALATGWGIDACSAGDIWLARRVEAPKESVSLTGVGLARDELAHTCNAIGWVNLCTLPQVEQLKIPPARVGLRVAAESNRTAIDYATNKLGLTPNEVADAAEMLRDRGMHVQGLHCHVGSGLLDVPDYVETLYRSLTNALDVLPDYDRGMLEYINVGGGLGIAYDHVAGGVDPTALAEALAGMILVLSERVGRRLELHCEPGEWVVGPAGAVLMRVIGAFDRGGIRVAIVDASLNQFMGTSFSRPNNAISVTETHGDRPIPHDVYGCTNSPGDVFCRSRLLPRLEEGDIVILHCAGAYGYSRGGRFNEYPQAPEVFVDGTRFAVIRDRETLEVLSEGVSGALLWQS